MNYAKVIILSFVFFLINCEKSEKIKTESPLSKIEYLEIPENYIYKGDSNINRALNGNFLYKNKPFSGYYCETHPEGVFKYKTGYFNGLKENIDVSFHRNGKKKYERPYHLGKKQGEHIGWYENGQVEYKLSFDKGLSVGTHYSYHKNGQLYKLQNYKEGHEFGTQKVWRPDGKIRANYVIREDGKKYGLMGLKRCAVIDGENEKVKQ